MRYLYYYINNMTGMNLDEKMRRLNAADPELWGKRRPGPREPQYPDVFRYNDIYGLAAELSLRPTARGTDNVDREKAAVLYRGNWYVSDNYIAPYIRIMSVFLNNTEVSFPHCCSRPSESVANLRTVTLSTLDSIDSLGHRTKSATRR